MKRKLFATLITMALFLTMMPTFAMASINQLADQNTDPVFGNQAWTVNGAMRIVHANGTIEPVLDYSKSIWVIPPADRNQQFVSTRLFAEENHMSFDGGVHLVPFASDKVSTPFYRFNSSGESVRVFPATVPEGGTVNLIFSCEDTGEIVGWWPNVPAHGLNPSVWAEFTTTAQVRYAIHANTFGEQVWARIIMTADTITSDYNHYDTRIKINLSLNTITDLMGGDDWEMDVVPILYQGHTLFPVRFVAEALGAEVNWNQHSNEVILTLGTNSLTFTVGETLPGMDIPAMSVNGRTMVPIRFIAEFFGAVVTWDGDTIEIVK